MASAVRYDDAAFSAHGAQIVKKYGKAARQSERTWVTLGLKPMKVADDRWAPPPQPVPSGAFRRIPADFGAASGS